MAAGVEVACKPKRLNERKSSGIFKSTPQKTKQITTEPGKQLCAIDALAVTARVSPRDMPPSSDTQKNDKLMYGRPNAVQLHEDGLSAWR